jgi:hypothetical protein
MKFKLIKSMAHNWTHSFMSGMNWVDGDYVFEDMHKLARERPGQKVVITWLPERQEELFALTPRIRESLKHYRKGLPEHLSCTRLKLAQFQKCVLKFTWPITIGFTCGRTSLISEEKNMYSSFGPNGSAEQSR